MRLLKCLAAILMGMALATGPAAAGDKDPDVLRVALLPDEDAATIIKQNEADNHASGHGGVPNGIFRGEPFWGHDRFETLVWRLKQNGLTKRWPPAVD